MTVLDSQLPCSAIPPPATAKNVLTQLTTCHTYIHMPQQKAVTAVGVLPCIFSLMPVSPVSPCTLHLRIFSANQRSSKNSDAHAAERGEAGSWDPPLWRGSGVRLPVGPPFGLGCSVGWLVCLGLDGGSLMDKVVMDGGWVFRVEEVDGWMVGYVGSGLWDRLLDVLFWGGDVVEGAGWRERGGSCLCGSLNYSHRITLFL